MLEPYFVEFSEGRGLNLALVTEYDITKPMAKVCILGNPLPVTCTQEESDVLRKALKELKHAV